ncbi:MAG TPA: EAL domain-containing protein [Kofleriaceae bacterium]|nr:EAL domain-containing protein [Kofleriaceae bacterium]
MLRARSPRRVLFVDPVDDFLVSCATLAGEHGIEADTASAQTALHQLERHPYNVVAIDLELLGPDGTPLVEDICAQYPATTLIAVTRRSGLERPRSHRVDTAIATIVLRPFEPAELATALGDAFDLHERRTRHRATSLDQARVLLVEDNEGDAELVTEYLSEIWGASVSRATRVEDAARAIRDHTYHFILSDLTLPDARGLDAVRRLQPLAPDTPFVVLTGIDDEDLALQAVQQGAQDYLVKGQLDASSLRRTLRHARERKQVYNRLFHLTRHDPLTGAANRAALRERIDRALARARRKNLSFAVMFVDLDRFKAINDTCGHDIGDAVLCEIAERLHQAVRTSDLVARLGGDEFAVLLEDLEPSSCPFEVAERIRTSLEQPIEVDGHKLVVTASVGVALYPEIGGSIDDLLRAADTAMYLAKGRGRNNVQLSGAVPAEVRARLAIAADLQHALERGELSLHFQPQYTVDRQRVVAFEALLRWTRKGSVQIPPAEFIPLLEQNGRIIAVGEWVLERACEQLAGWRAAGWTDLRVAVNLSARQIAQAGLVDCVRRCARRFDVPTACIELEITESMLMGDIQQATATLADLRALGVRLAIDDFGTGYSSLAYLSRFAVDCLKIDRSFIHDVNADRERALITSAIVTLGHHLGLQVIAEGVETQEQLDFLTANRCDLVQGYLLAAPADAATFRDPGRSRFLTSSHTVYH